MVIPKSVGGYPENCFANATAGGYNDRILTEIADEFDFVHGFHFSYFFTNVQVRVSDRSVSISYIR